jgi:hypothetical protein
MSIKVCKKIPFFNVKIVRCASVVAIAKNGNIFGNVSSNDVLGA